MKILVIEDEPDLAQSIISYLSGEDYVCEWASSYAEAVEKVHSFNYDCILLDIMLPGGSGMSVLEELKKLNRQDGVIIISAKDSFEDKIRGLQLGSDDYLAKPFHLPELGARIYSVIRRRQFGNSNIAQHGNIRIDLLSKKVVVRENEVPLTKKELDLLLYFIGNKNRVISKSSLAEHLSGDFADMLDNHDFIYAHIKNLKRKLAEAGCDNYLKTIYGTGYRWEE